MNKTVKLSKGFIRLPLAMAHGMLSDLPIEYGIYSDLFGCIFFTLFSTSRHTSAGSAAFLMMIIGSSIESNFGSEGERNLFTSRYQPTVLLIRTVDQINCGRTD